jgi:hypothetical protein
MMSPHPSHGSACHWQICCALAEHASQAQPASSTSRWYFWQLGNSSRLKNVTGRRPPSRTATGGTIAGARKGLVVLVKSATASGTHQAGQAANSSTLPSGNCQCVTKSKFCAVPYATGVHASLSIFFFPFFLPSLTLALQMGINGTALAWAGSNWTTSSSSGSTVQGPATPLASNLVHASLFNKTGAGLPGLRSHWQSEVNPNTTYSATTSGSGIQACHGGHSSWVDADSRAVRAIQ